MNQVSVTVQPHGFRARGKRGNSFRRLCHDAGLELNSPCGGLGRCGKCRVIITEGHANIGELTKAEQKHLTRQELSAGFRLACQVTVLGEVEVIVPKETMPVQLRLQTEGIDAKTEILPLVKKTYLEMPKPTLRSLKPDLERLLSALCRGDAGQVAVSTRVLSRLPDVLRRSGWKVTATIWSDQEILDVEGGDTSKSVYGFAVDIGTTKVACYLVSLLTGETVAVSSMINPQVQHGEDIIERLTYAMKGESERAELTRLIRKGISRLVAECCSKSEVNPDHIYEATVVGNTAMHHMFLGIAPNYLAVSPYVPAVKQPLNVQANELGIEINPHAKIHFLPLIAGFVGSDAVADILATGIYNKKELSLLLDIGTNTEIVLGNQQRIVACSCASGPAFEGAHIKDGMKASSGAIESCRIDPATRKISFRTVDGVAPRGLCGSGIVDAVAQMLGAGLIDENGTILADAPYVRSGESGQREFLIVRTSEGYPRDIAVTQKDIREVQLAKGAVQTGISVLMKTVRIEPRQLRHVYLAGAFGTCIGPASAKKIGMIPEVPLGIIRKVGNAAGTGARMALISSKARQLCASISSKAQYVELAAHKDFRSTFMRSLSFPSQST